MIITCNNCNKNFDIASNLIPEKGRLLQCNGCDHKWFFKKEIIKSSIPIVEIKNNDEEPAPFIEEVAQIETRSTVRLLDKETNDFSILEKNTIKNETEKNEIKEDDKEIELKTHKNKKNYNILSLIVVFIISFIALIIVLDTFQKPFAKIIPNIEFLLYNLYESINDIILFFKDLI
jgi:predicted Zn finger-like uncharacterized protein